MPRWSSRRLPDALQRLGVVFIALGALVAGAAIWLFYAAGTHTRETIVSIPQGASAAHVARLLDAAGVIRAPVIFRLGARLGGDAGKLHAGEFAIPPRASMAETLEIITGGEVVLYGFTIPEGLTSQQIAERLRALPYLAGDIADIPAEGTLWPETYHVPRGTTRAAILAQMQTAQRAELPALWASRQPDLPLNDMNEAVILASIVEKETGIAEERRLVAAVFVNRLRRGMRLQSDPTIIYGLTGGAGALGRPIRRSEIAGKTPYNTYQIDGLPPTPIANPGRAALAAVLDPADSAALYFVADGSGGHVFADTLEAHNRNVQNWRRESRK